MKLAGLNIGLAVTGSYCTFKTVVLELEKIVEEGATVYPIISENAGMIDTRFGKAENWLEALEKITGQKVLKTTTEVEPIGPQSWLDVILVAPCTGNTLAKLANGITDTPVLMAIKAHLRNQKPVVIAVSTNDGLGLNAKNLGLLLNSKGIYFVPFGQDSPSNKQNSLVAHMDKMSDTVLEAIKGRQLQPLLVEYK